MNSSQTSLSVADLLVVDDNPDNLRLLSIMLNNHGYKVRKVISGTLALRVVSKAPPDLILLDIDMPQMNGYEVCQHLKSNPKISEIPVIFLSALDDTSNKVKAFSVGGVDYITKPFQVAEVLARVENQLRMRTLSKQLFDKNIQLQQEVYIRQQAENALVESAIKIRKQNQILVELARNSALNQGDLEVALKEITEAIARNFLIERVSVWLFDTTFTKLQCLDLFELSVNQHCTKIEWQLADYPVYFKALVENQTLIVEDTLVDSRIQELAESYLIPLNITSVLNEPIHVAGKIVGVLSFEQVGETHQWMLEDQNFSRSVADLISLAIEARERRKAEVREREKTRALELTLEELKHTQAQLVQTEKMSSLGQLVAGVAHEINNPVSFIYGNLTPANQYFQDLIRLIEAYQASYPHSSPEIKQITSEIDLEFLAEDWQHLMKSIQVGAERIQEIVFSLQVFSKQTKTELKSVDIHEGIDNMLTILQHRLQTKDENSSIQVIKEYNQLPKISCYSSQLNQVFMNLLTNAIDALENQFSPQIITIRTEAIARKNSDSLPKYVSISIADNGVGMDEEIQKKIFDPFFTTKPVGSGTGLGLSISYQIVVDKHQGFIHCISTPGKGTEFTVKIPVRL